MHCPKCKSLNTKVVDSRFVENKNVTRRRRQCVNCFVRFTTFERIEITDLQVIKSNNNKESYDRDKLKRGIVFFKTIY
jgi:transcriptional repressor NrdR